MSADSSANVPDQRGEWHPIEIGASVAVIRFAGTMSPPVLEGYATVQNVAHGRRHHYWLSFDGDPRVRERFVHPGYQGNPNDTLEWLIELWRASLTPPSHAEFFPADDQCPEVGDEHK